MRDSQRPLTNPRSGELCLDICRMAPYNTGIARTGARDPDPRISASGVFVGAVREARKRRAGKSAVRESRKRRAGKAQSGRAASAAPENVRKLWK